MNLLLVIVQAGLLEYLLNSVLATVGDLQVQIRDPDVKLLSLFADVDRLDGTLGYLTSFRQVADLHLESHVRDPELGRIRLAEQ